jgi:hypothetical protein
MGMYCSVSIASQQDAKRSSGAWGLFGAFQALTATSTAESVSLEKSWHGLHYLLTGEVWEGDGPLAFLLAGGEQEGGDDEAPRWFSPEEVAEIHRALAGVSDEQLWSRFDAAEMEESEVYPGVWDEDEEELQEEYLTYFHQLKQIVAAAAESGRGLMVSIG